MREAGTGSPVASRARRSAGVAEGGRAIGERFLYDYGTISVLGGFVDPRPARGVREELMLFLYDLIPSGSHVCRAWPSAITNHHSTSDENESPSTLRLPLPASPVGNPHTPLAAGVGLRAVRRPQAGILPLGNHHCARARFLQPRLQLLAVFHAVCGRRVRGAAGGGAVAQAGVDWGRFRAGQRGVRAL